MCVLIVFQSLKRSFSYNFPIIFLILYLSSLHLQTSPLSFFYIGLLLFLYVLILFLYKLPMCNSYKCSIYFLNPTGNLLYYTYYYSHIDCLFVFRCRFALFFSKSRVSTFLHIFFILFIFFKCPRCSSRQLVYFFYFYNIYIYLFIQGLRSLIEQPYQSLHVSYMHYIYYIFYIVFYQISFWSVFVKPLTPLFFIFFLSILTYFTCPRCSSRQTHILHHTCTYEFKIIFSFSNLT